MAMKRGEFVTLLERLRPTMEMMPLAGSAEVPVACPICTNKSLAVRWKPSDGHRRYHAFVRCGLNCGFEVQHPQAFTPKRAN